MPNFNLQRNSLYLKSSCVSVCANRITPKSGKHAEIRSKLDMYKLSVYIYLNRVPFPPSLKYSGLKNVLKLGGCQENFKVTLLERPPEKSCSTSILQEISLENCEVERDFSVGLS